MLLEAGSAGSSLHRSTFRGPPALVVDAGDLACKNRLLFALTCGDSGFNAPIGALALLSGPRLEAPRGLVIEPLEVPLRH